jgi:hypothetical protein
VQDCIEDRRQVHHSPQQATVQAHCWRHPPSSPQPSCTCLGAGSSSSSGEATQEWRPPGMLDLLMRGSLHARHMSRAMFDNHCVIHVCREQGMLSVPQPSAVTSRSHSGMQFLHKSWKRWVSHASQQGQEYMQAAATSKSRCRVKRTRPL